MARVKYLSAKTEGFDADLSELGFPNFHRSGSITGMKDKYYGEDALLVRQGSYIYNVSSWPAYYRLAH